MESKSLISTKWVIFIYSATGSIGYISVFVVLRWIGLDCQATFTMAMFGFPGLLFVALHSFYKGLLKHYELKPRNDNET